MKLNLYSANVCYVGTFYNCIFIDRVLNYIPASMVPGLVDRKKLDGIKKLSLTVVATSNTLNFMFETSTVR